MEIKKPLLEVEGEKYEIKKIKPKHWREFFKFDTERGEMPLSELMQGHCEAIAPFFDDEMTPEYLLENMDIADVLKVYHDIRTYLMELVSSKLYEPKNAETGDKQD